LQTCGFWLFWLAAFDFGADLFPNFDALRADSKSPFSTSRALGHDWLFTHGSFPTNPGPIRDIAPSEAYFRKDPETALYLDATNGQLQPLDWVDALVVLGDCGSGASAILQMHNYSFANIDYCIGFQREPKISQVSPWVCMTSKTRATAGGSGQCRSTIFDQNGMVASTIQNLVLKRSREEKSKM